MSLGRAIEAPDMPNIREILTNGESAVLFAAQDKETFADAIPRVCAGATLLQRIAGCTHAAIEAQGLILAHNAARVVELACTPLDAAVR